MPSFYLSMSTGRQVLTWVDAFMRTCKSPDKIIGCKVLASHPNGVVILGKTLCYVNWSYYRHILDSTRCFPYFRPMCVTVPLLKLNVEFPKKWRVDFFLYSHSRHFVVRLFQLAVWNTARVICPDISKLMPTKTRKLANINKFMRQKKLRTILNPKNLLLPLFKNVFPSDAFALNYLMTKSVLQGESVKVWLQNFSSRQ